MRPVLWAQEAAPDESNLGFGDYFIERTGEGRRFIQRLSWPKDPAVLRYEVFIEEAQGTGYRELQRESTEENFLHVSLSPGTYRYRLGVYNLLNRLAHTTEWVNFEVLKALQPVIRSFSPQDFFLDDESPLDITISGEDIAEEADSMLRPPGGAGQGIRPQSSDLRENTLRLSFNKEQLAPGSYEVYIKNPGGLEDARGTLTVHPQRPKEIAAVTAPPAEERQQEEQQQQEEQRRLEEPRQQQQEQEQERQRLEELRLEQEQERRRLEEQPQEQERRRLEEQQQEQERPQLEEQPQQEEPRVQKERKVRDRSQRPDFIVSAGYAPLLPLYGALFQDDAFTSPFFPLGASIRLGLIPLKRSWGYVGAELGISWYTLKDEKERYTVSLHVPEAQLDLLYQLWLPKHTMAFKFRLGAGLNFIGNFFYNYGEAVSDPGQSALFLSLDTGISFQWHIMGSFFIDAGADFTHVLSTGEPSQPGYLRPAFNFGWQF